MTFDNLVRDFARKHRLPIKAARAMTRALLSDIDTHVQDCGRLHVPGFGVFYRQERKARRVKWEHEGESGWHEVPATTRLAFRAGKAVKRRRG